MAPHPHKKEVSADPQAELHQFGAFAKAVAEAAMDAAGTITEDTFYKIDEIFIKVSPNPGPKTYTVVIKPVPPPV